MFPPGPTRHENEPFATGPSPSRMRVVRVVMGGWLNPPPLVVTSGVGSATNHSIGWVVIGGQTLVLVLTLVVTPVTYALFDDLREKRLAVKSLRWFRSRLSAADPVTPV